MSDGKNDTGKSDGPWIDQVYKNIEADDLLQQEIAKLEHGCGPEVTDHFWHQDTAAGLTLGCRNCDAVWNPPPEIRVWVLGVDVLRQSLKQSLDNTATMDVLLVETIKQRDALEVEIEKRKEDERALAAEVYRLNALILCANPEIPDPVNPEDADL